MVNQTFGRIVHLYLRTNFIVTLKTHQDFVIKQKPAPRVCHTAVVHEVIITYTIF